MSIHFVLLHLPTLPSKRLIGSYRTLAYYRFHKPIGQGKWGRYLERYRAPGALETRHPILSVHRPTFHMLKVQNQWRWKLPKQTAFATTPDQVLQLSLCYRSKPKAPYHFLILLKRLVDTGGCDPYDWRFLMLIQSIQKHIKCFINIPRLALYFGKLKALDALENLVRFLMPNIHLYNGQQLTMITTAFSLCHLHDPILFDKITAYLEPMISQLTTSSLIAITKSYATCRVHDSTLMKQISQEIQLRCSTHPNMLCFPASTISSHSFEVNIEHLSALAYAFSELKYIDFSLFNILTSSICHQLITPENLLTPYLLFDIVKAYTALKINEIVLFRQIFLHMGQFMYDYPAKCLLGIGAILAPFLPSEVDEINKVKSKIIVYIVENMDLLNFESVQYAAQFLDHLGQKAETFNEAYKALQNQIIILQDDTESIFNVAKLLEVISQNGLENCEIVTILLSHAIRILKLFEPDEYLITLSALKAFKSGGVIQDPDKTFMHLFVKHATENQNRFTPAQWQCFVSDLRSLKYEDSLQSFSCNHMPFCAKFDISSLPPQQKPGLLS